MNRWQRLLSWTVALSVPLFTLFPFSPLRPCSGQAFPLFASPAVGEVVRPAPEITGESWLNAQPTRLADLRGKVVLVEFWTYGCYNCRNVEPYVKAWHKKYSERGLTVVGVHCPEFAAEHNIDNVKQYLREHDIQYAVAIDNDFATWNRYDNHAWPSFYLIDKQGVIRYTHIGEGNYPQTEQQIQTLLGEASGE